MMSPISGTVFKDRNFVYPDNGESGIKYIVVLCDSVLGGNKVIAVRTTSQPKGKSTVFGCHQYRRRLMPAYFFTGKVAEIFTLENWIMLDYVAEYDGNGFGRLEGIGRLSTEMTVDILSCVANNGSQKLFNYVVKSAEDQLDLFRKGGLI